MQENILGFCLGEKASLAPLPPDCVKIINSLKKKAGLTRTEKPNRNTTAQLSPTQNKQQLCSYTARLIRKLLQNSLWSKPPTELHRATNFLLLWMQTSMELFMLVSPHFTQLGLSMFYFHHVFVFLLSLTEFLRNMLPPHPQPKTWKKLFSQMTVTNEFLRHLQ